MINAVYALNQSEIALLTSLLSQLDVWFENEVSLQIRLYLEDAISNRTITYENIQKLLLLLKKSKKQHSYEPIQKTNDPETASDSWDEMLELMETHQKAHAKQIELDAAHRTHLQLAVYNKNLPSKCMLALHKLISRNKGKQHRLRRHI